MGAIATRECHRGHGPLLRPKAARNPSEPPMGA